MRLVVEVYLMGPWNSLKCGAPAFSGSYLRHGLLLAVYTEVVKDHTLWHTYIVNNVKIAIGLLY